MMPFQTRSTAQRFFVLACVLVVLLSGPAGGIGAISAQDPGEPQSFYGAIEDGDGTPAPAGTEVFAIVDGDVEDSITVEEAGQYGGSDGLDERLDVNTGAGDEVVFTIDSSDGPEAVESPFDLDEADETPFELDLTFPDDTFDESSADDSDDDDSSQPGGGTGGDDDSTADDDDADDSTDGTATTDDDADTASDDDPADDDTDATDDADDSADDTTAADSDDADDSVDETEASEDDTSDDTAPTDDDEDGFDADVPGFGVLITILAVVSAGFLAMRHTATSRE